MQVIRHTDIRYCIPVEICSDAPKGDQYVVLAPFEVELPGGHIAFIPEGFVTDCHSTPPWSQSLLPAYNCKTALAAVVHDYLYMNWEDFARRNSFYPGLEWEPVHYVDGEERRYADRAYLHLMNQFAPGAWRNKLYYRAVRLFGGVNWRRFRKQQLKNESI